MCITCQYQWPVSQNVTNMGWFLFLFSIEAGCFGSMGVTNFWKLKNIHWTKPKILPQSLDFGNWLFKKTTLFKIPPPKKGGLISTSKHLLDFGAPVVPATKVQSHSSPNDWWTAYSVLLRALVLPKLQRKNKRLSYLQLVFWDLLSISWQQVSIYNVRVQVVALYVGCGDEYLNVWCVQQHGDQVLAQLHLKTGWRYSVPSMEQSEHLNSIQDVQKDLLCKRSTSVLYYSRTHTHMYGHVTCVLCLYVRNGTATYCKYEVLEIGFEHYFQTPTEVLEGNSPLPSLYAQLHWAHLQLPQVWKERYEICTSLYIPRYCPGSPSSILTAIRWLSFCRCETWKTTSLHLWWSVFIQPWSRVSIQNKKSWRTKTSQFKEENKSSRLEQLHFNGLKDSKRIGYNCVLSRLCFQCCPESLASLRASARIAFVKDSAGAVRCKFGQEALWVADSLLAKDIQNGLEATSPGWRLVSAKHAKLFLTKIDWSVDTGLFHRIFWVTLFHVILQMCLKPNSKSRQYWILVDVAAISIPNLSINSQAAPLRARKSDLLVSFCRSFSCSNAYLHLSNI